MSFHDVTANLLVGALALLSLVLTVLAARAWAYVRDSRSLFLVASFLLLFTKALVLLVGMFRLADWNTLLPVSLAFDLAIAFGFYIASLR